MRFGGRAWWVVALGMPWVSGCACCVSRLWWVGAWAARVGRGGRAGCGLGAIAGGERAGGRVVAPAAGEMSCSEVGGTVRRRRSCEFLAGMAAQTHKFRGRARVTSGLSDRRSGRGARAVAQTCYGAAMTCLSYGSGRPAVVQSRYECAMACVSYGSACSASRIAPQGAHGHVCSGAPCALGYVPWLRVPGRTVCPGYVGSRHTVCLRPAERPWRRCALGDRIWTGGGVVEWAMQLRERRAAAVRTHGRRGVGPVLI